MRRNSLAALACLTLLLPAAQPSPAAAQSVPFSFCMRNALATETGARARVVFRNANMQVTEDHTFPVAWAPNESRLCMRRPQAAQVTVSWQVWRDGNWMPACRVVMGLDQLKTARLVGSPANPGCTITSGV